MENRKTKGINIMINAVSEFRDHTLYFTGFNLIELRDNKNPTKYKTALSLIPTVHNCHIVLVFTNFIVLKFVSADR